MPTYRARKDKPVFKSCKPKISLLIYVNDAR